MLIYDYNVIGNKLLAYRKKRGLTQSEIAELAGISDRAYAEIERGTVNMRMETILKICNVLQITPDDILTEENISLNIYQTDVIERLDSCSSVEKYTALKLMEVYLDSIKK